MQASEGCLQPYSIIYNTLPSLKKTKDAMDTPPSSPLKKLDLNQELTSSKNNPFRVFLKKAPRTQKTPVNEIQHQVKNYLSLIEDPLWKSICTDMIDMMGPSAVLKMWGSRLGSFSRQHKTMNLYCQTEEIAQFIQQYSFVILGSLQRYFPMMKDLKIKIKPTL